MINTTTQFCKAVVALFFSFNAVAQNMERDTVPLTLNAQNTNYVQVIFNEIDTLNLNFDTGTTGIILTEHTLKSKLKTDVSLYNRFYSLKIGRFDYQSKVYDTQLTGHGTDGRFGWDLFNDKVVELDYDQNIMVVHSELPENISQDSCYTTLRIKSLDNIFLVEGTLVHHKVEDTANFVFDTGYQRTVILDKTPLEVYGFPVDEMKEIKRVMMRGAQGKEIPVITLNLEGLRLGKYELTNIPAQLLTANRPIEKYNLHFLGNEILKRFNCFLDFPGKRMYLKPNTLFKETYIEE